VREPGVRDRRGSGRALPAHRDPALDQRLIRASGDAQFRDLLVPGGVGPVLAETECRARALGQQVGAPGRGLGQLGDRRGLLIGGEPPALGVPGGGSRDLGVAKTIRIRAGHAGMIEYAFE
jgi:hypothetical protein